MRYLALLYMLLLLMSCASEPAVDTAPGPEQIVRLSDSEIKGLDPQKVSDLSSLRVAADQFEGLTRLGASGEAEPGLAKDWRTSPDGRTWTFVLRENLRFSDGTAFDATRIRRWRPFRSIGLTRSGTDGLPIVRWSPAARIACPSGS